MATRGLPAAANLTREISNDSVDSFVPSPSKAVAVNNGRWEAQRRNDLMLARPSAPPRSGLLTVDEVTIQKEELRKTLDLQLQQAEACLREQAARQREYLRSQAEQARVVVRARWDQQLRAQELAAEQGHMQEIQRLQEELRAAQASVRSQATQMVLAYHQRKVEQDMNLARFNTELQQWEADYMLKAHFLQSGQVKSEADLQRMLVLRQSQVQQRAMQHLPELPLTGWDTVDLPLPAAAKPPWSSGPYPTGGSVSWPQPSPLGSALGGAQRHSVLCSSEEY